MRNSIKKLISIISVTLVTSTLVSSSIADAASLKKEENNIVNEVSTDAVGGYYGTNPNNGVGVEKQYLL